MTVPKKIYASNSGFKKGRLIFTTYDSGCLRKILINSWGYRPPISGDYTKIGEANEQRYEKALTDAGISYERESPCTVPVRDDGSVIFSGRRDFVLATANGPEIIELKATQSKTKLQMMKEGKYVIENLAQTVAYMFQAGAHTGKLVYTYFKPGASDPSLEKVYNIAVDDFGDILVNDKNSGYTITDYLMHREGAADAVLNNTVYDRPVNYDAPFGSPCAYCPFKAACQAFDTTDGLELVDAVKNCGLTPNPR